MTSDATPDIAAILTGILRDHGPVILADRARLHDLLREKAGDAPRQVHLLMNAFDAGVPARLQAAGGHLPADAVGEETSRMVDQFGSSAELARDAVETWARATSAAPDEPTMRPASAVPAETRPLSPASVVTADPIPRDTAKAQDGEPPALPRAAAPLPLPLPPAPAAMPLPLSGQGQAPVAPLPLPTAHPPALHPAARPPMMPPATMPSHPAAAPLPLPLPPSPAAPAIQPLPPSFGASGTPPLPPSAPHPPPITAAMEPSPVRPLPGAASTPIRPLPGATSSIAPLPVGPPPRRSGTPIVRVVGTIFGLGLIGMVSYGLYQAYAPKQGIRVASGAPSAPAPEHGPEQGPGPAPPPAAGPGPAPAPAPAPATGPKVGSGPGKTDEGYPIATVEPGVPFPASRIDGSDNTLLFTFGLNVSQTVFTYQAAFGFEGSNPSGKGLIKAIKGGREATTGEQDVKRIVQEDGTTGFTLSAKLSPNPIQAPAICLSVLAGKPQDRLDIANGAGYFCAFGTDRNGFCDGSVRLGCGDLR